MDEGPREDTPDFRDGVGPAPACVARPDGLPRSAPDRLLEPIDLGRRNALEAEVGPLPGLGRGTSRRWAAAASRRVARIDGTGRVLPSMNVAGTSPRHVRGPARRAGAPPRAGRRGYAPRPSATREPARARGFAVALVRDATGKVRTVRPGERIGAWRVLAVGNDSASFRQGATVRRLAVGETAQVQPPRAQANSEVPAQ